MYTIRSSFVEGWYKHVGEKNNSIFDHLATIYLQTAITSGNGVSNIIKKVMGVCWKWTYWKRVLG